MEPDKQPPTESAAEQPVSGQLEAEAAPPVITHPTVTKPPVKKDWRGLIIAVLAVALVAVGAVFWFVLKDDNETTDDATNETTDGTSTDATDGAGDTAEDALGPVPDLINIIYSFGDTYEGPGAIYHRPVAGGDRVQLASLSSLGSVNANNHQLVSRSYAYIKDNTQIWYGEGVAAPTMIYELSSSGFISSLAVSANGSRVAFATVPDISSSETAVSVVIIDSDGDGEMVLIDDTNDGAFWMQPQKWVANDRKIVLTGSNYGNDAPQPMPWIVDVASGAIVKLMEDKTGDDIASFSVSPDGTRMVYVENTVDEDIFVEGLRGYYIGAPFTVKVLDVASGASTVVETYGTLDAADPQYYNGDTGWKFSAGGVIPLYVKDNSVLAKSVSGITTAFESSNPIIAKILFASDNEILISSASSQESYWSGEHSYTHYDYATDTATKLMNATSYTYNIGLIVE